MNEDKGNISVYMFNEIDLDAGELNKRISRLDVSLYNYINTLEKEFRNTLVHSKAFYFLLQQISDIVLIKKQYEEASKCAKEYDLQANHFKQYKQMKALLHDLYTRDKYIMESLLKASKTAGMKIALMEILEYTLEKNITIYSFLHLVTCGGAMGIKAENAFELYEILAGRIIERWGTIDHYSLQTLNVMVDIICNEVSRINENFVDFANKIKVAGEEFEQLARITSPFFAPMLPKPGTIRKKGGRKQKNRYQ